MRIRTQFPREIRVIEHTWIRMSDGTNLSARIWLPVDAEESPVPAILEYIPYRKDDYMAQRDALRHPYFAGHGYAAVRVDIRGSGSSEGQLLNEYLPQELEDGVEVIAWLAAQPWCTGAVGMMGKSWGGFNSLQVAALRPPALKAIITVCSTDDRYNDDWHFKGGCFLASGNLFGSAIMHEWHARPPDPKIVGDRWREMWLERLATPPFIEDWIRHPHRDAYWRHGSVCEDYSAIQCAVFAVSGWEDPYSNVIPRLLQHLDVPRRGLIGPWAHWYPEQGVPGPPIGFLQECLRWWDRWLKEIDTGVDDEPILRMWLQDVVEPKTFYDSRPGQWIADSELPAPSVETHEFFLADDGVVEEPGEGTPFSILGVQTCGADAGLWVHFGEPGALPGDQRSDDAASLCFTSDPLEESLDVVGYPSVDLEVAVDRPTAFLAVRLCAVLPSGASALVTRGFLNLTHLRGQEQADSLEPGRRYMVRVVLDATATRIPAGARIRVAVSPTCWPWIWPSPEPVTLTVFGGSSSRVQLPVRAADPDDAQLREFEPPEVARPLALMALSDDGGSAGYASTVARNRATGEMLITGGMDATATSTAGALVFPDGLELREQMTDTYRIIDGDPQSAQIDCWRFTSLSRDGWEVAVEATATMSSDARMFHVTSAITASENGEKVFHREWVSSAPRDGH
jgi:putative CocE/NonD family hydrolase